MRNLGSGAGSLLEAQQANSTEPYVKVDIGPEGAPDYVFNSTQDEIISVVHIERPYGGTATIVLNNYDKSLKDIDFRGRRVEISYWFEGIGGTAGKAAPLWVLSDRELSSEGKNQVELICIDIWNVLSLLKMGVGGTRLTGTITGTLALTNVLTGETSGATGTVIVVGADYVHIGSVSGQFVVGEKAKKDASNYITIDSTDIVGTSSGPAWNWETRDKTIENIFDQLLSSIGVEVDIDDSDGIVDTYKPPYSTTMGQTTYLDVVQDLMRKTKCGFRMQNDGDLHLFEVVDSPSVDYEYNTDHVFYVDIRDLSLMLPNRVICVDVDGGGYKGSAEDAAAIAQFQGIAITSFVSAERLQSDDEADSVAAAELSRSKWNSAAGQIVAPMNVGQELFDYIKVIDSRNDITYYGWIGGIVREWKPGVYRITLEMGNLTGSEGIPGGKDMPAPNIVLPPPQVHPLSWEDIDWSAILPKAVQGYHHDIHFTASDWRTVTWTGGGTIKFYDGTTQNINTGSYAMPTDAIYYIYFDLDDANPNVLKTTTSYASVMTMKTGLLCLAQRSAAGSTGGILATIIPSYGKEPLLTPDFIDMTGLKSFTYPDGTQIQGIFSTQIQDGHIYLSAETYYANETYNIAGKEIEVYRSASAPSDHAKLWFNTTTGVMNVYSGGEWKALEGEWYRKTGVAIDAAKGIALYGGQMSLKTYPTEYDYIHNINVQCSVDSLGRISAGGGDIILDSSGITIKGDSLRLLDSNSVQRGTVRGVLAGGLELYAFGAGSLWIGTVGGSIILNPGSLYVYPDSTSVSLGNSVKYWSYMYANHVRFKDWNVFQKHDDIALLRQIKPKKDSEMVDIDTVPDEIKEEGFIDIGATVGLLAGAVSQLADRIDNLEGG